MPSAPFFEPDPFKGVLGPSLAGKRPKTDQNFNLDSSFLLRPLVSTLGFLIHDFGAGRESSISGVWAAPGSRETIQKYGGLRPPYF